MNARNTLIVGSVIIALIGVIIFLVVRDQEDDVAVVDREQEHDVQDVGDIEIMQDEDDFNRQAAEDLPMLTMPSSVCTAEGMTQDAEEMNATVYTDNTQTPPRARADLTIRRSVDNELRDLHIVLNEDWILRSWTHGIVIGAHEADLLWLYQEGHSTMDALTFGYNFTRMGSLPSEWDCSSWEVDEDTFSTPDDIQYLQHRAPGV